jgi:hypothetical protein
LSETEDLVKRHAQNQPSTEFGRDSATLAERMNSSLTAPPGEGPSTLLQRQRPLSAAPDKNNTDAYDTCQYDHLMIADS